MLDQTSLERLAAVVLVSMLPGCANPVPWECTYDDNGAIAVWSEGEMACGRARDAGYQILGQAESDCWDAGNSGCSCTFTDTSRCGGGWND